MVGSEPTGGSSVEIGGHGEYGIIKGSKSKEGMCYGLVDSAGQKTEGDQPAGDWNDVWGNTSWRRTRLG